MAAPDPTNIYTNTTLGIQFEYPSNFIVGRYRPEPEFENTIAVVEPKVLGRLDSQNIPVGEIPVISIALQAGGDARFTLRELCRPEFKTKIGKFTVYRLPGFPGPYGDQAYCYYVRLSFRRVLEVVAHRFYFNEGATGKPEETHFDDVIEDMIRSLRIVKK